MARSCFAMPPGVELGVRIGRGELPPLERPILMCEGTCAVIGPHRRLYQDGEREFGTPAPPMWECEGCGKPRRYGV